MGRSHFPISMALKPVLYASVAIFLLGGACLLVLYKGQPTSLPPEVFEVPVLELADTPEEREQGLSGRTSLEPGYGMLFVFEDEDAYGFWMKDMHIPIDILWLSDTGVILGIEHSVSPDTYPAVFYPPQPVMLVLEVAAGTARANGWDTGDAIRIPLQN